MVAVKVGQQFHQLPMFMSAREIQTTLTPGDYYPRTDADHAAMWDRKLTESNDVSSPTNSQQYDDDWRAENNDDSKTLTESIAKHGVRQPVNVYHDAESGKSYLRNGHHRVSVAASMDPHALLPVHHSVFGTKESLQ